MELLLSNGAVEQILAFATIIMIVVLFLWNGLRYDVVTLIAFLVVILTGLISVEQALHGFSHPVVIIVGSMFIISQAVVNSGAVEVVTRKIVFLKDHIVFQLLTLTILVTLVSAFINSVGALAIMIPVAIQMARQSKVSPTLFLLPLAFGSHLGGFLTLIGTPRNIIVSSFRESATGEHFQMFDFLYVGGAAAVVGILFLALLGWRWLSGKNHQPAEPFEVSNYVTEVRIPEGSPLADQYVKKLHEKEDISLKVISITRGDEEMRHLSGYEVLKVGDTLLIQSDPDTLTNTVETYKLDLAGKKSEEGGLSNTEEKISMEAVVPAQSDLAGTSWNELPLEDKFGVNLLAIARYGKSVRESLNRIRFKPGDIILLYGLKKSIEETLKKTGSYPLAERKLPFGRTLSIPLTLFIFIATITAASFGVAPLEVLFLTAAVIVVLLNLMPITKAYQSIQWPILLTLGAMITIGKALEESGGAQSIADGLLVISQYLSPELMVGLVLVTTIILSDFVSTTASAVLMSPIGIAVAFAIGVSVDPFLMAVAIGTSCAFLTPSSHESNALVMEAGGYSTKDYVKLGLPLEILIIIVSFPLLLWIWPL